MEGTTTTTHLSLRSNLSFSSNLLHRGLLLSKREGHGRTGEGGGRADKESRDGELHCRVYSIPTKKIGKHPCPEDFYTSVNVQATIACTLRLPFPPLLLTRHIPFCWNRIDTTMKLAVSVMFKYVTSMSE